MNIEKHINNLKEYIETDFAFREPIKNMSDFDRYCWNHCKDIETLLTAYEKEKGENVKLRLQDIPLIEGEVRAYKDRVNELKSELEKEKEKNKELESDIQQKNFEIKCLNFDIKNMYCEEGVIAILEDNFDLSREEAIQILEEE